MNTVNISEARRHLARLIDQAVKGEPFVMAKAGMPLVKVMALEAPVAAQQRRLGFLQREIVVADDFDTMGAEAIAPQFGGQG